MNRDEYIMSRLLEHYQQIKDKYEVVGIFIQGSQNYNLDIYDEDYKSDIDTKAIVLPSFDDIISNKDPVSTTLVLDNNEHIDVKDIRIMFNTFLKQNINFIEILFTKYKIMNPKYKELFNPMFINREKIAHYDINKALNCQCGMSQEKYVALKHPYPTIKDKIDKYGYDPKQLHHIIRMNDFIKKYVKGVSYEQCLIPDDPQELIDIKKGIYPLHEAEIKAQLVNKDTYEIAKANISEDNKRDEEVIEILNKVKENILKKRFKEELIDKEYEGYLIKEIKECEQLLEQEDEDDYYNQSVEARKVALCDALREYRIKDYYEKKE